MVRHGGPQKGTHNPADANDGAYLHHHFMFPEMAVGTGKHGKSHGREGHRQCRVDGHAKSDGEKSNGDAGAAGSHKADKGSQ